MRLGKGKHILIGFFLLFSLNAAGQAEKNFRFHFGKDMINNSVIAGTQSLSISYSVSDIDVESIIREEGEFFRISAPGHTRTSEPGKPELPVLSRLITVPEGSSINLRITGVKSTRIRPADKNFKGFLYPSQEGEAKQPMKDQKKFVIDRDLYSSKGLIGSDTVKIEMVGKVRGRQLANVIISPVRYDPASNIIEVITSMEIGIYFSGQKTPENKSGGEESILFGETLGKGILNFSSEEFVTGYSDQPVRMIIITDTIFRNHIDPLLKWKTQKGFKIDVLYRGEDFAGSTYTEIKETLRTIYNNYSETSVAPEYLLIIGDVGKIPYYGTGYVSDLYYGEFDGSGDYIPEMFIGRLPVRDTSELNSAINKIIEYEKFEFADTNNFYTRALVTPGKDENYADHMNGQVKYAVSNYLNDGNGIDGYHFYYPESYTMKDSIMKLIKNGLSFINYTGHGVVSGWQHVEIKSTDIRNFGNKSMYPFVISNACRTAQFDDTASFGNKMVVSKDLGAIGFIGCSNDSYWDEDFYWAVGTGTPSSDPLFETTGSGAYDRLFHTHGESPSEWYYTMGQVNYAGNLSVSSSTSSRKKYYWETYTLLGDPSLMPVIGTPGTFVVNLPDTIPDGIKSLSVITDPFSYVAISHFDTLWDASFASHTGSVTLELPGLSNDSCLIVITGQNKKPLIKTVYISELDKEFINLSYSGINDEQGNNNGQADFGETFYLDLKISNLGGTDAEGLYAKISSTSEWITITSDSVSIGTLAAGAEIQLSDDFLISVDQNVPDQGMISIDLILGDKLSEKHYIINILTHSPLLEIINCTIDDSVEGNGNHLADPGEIFDLVFSVRNRGSSDTSGELDINIHSGNITVLEPAVKSGLLETGEITEIRIAVTLSEFSGAGDYITLTSTLDCEPHLVSKDFSFRAGRIRESFESSSFVVFPWINVSTKPWIITEQYSQDGNISARSGEITHNGTSSLIIRTIYDRADSIRFWYKVSSEVSYDYFTFVLNGIEMVRESGETGWRKVSVPVTEGANIMEWKYRKDNSVSQGADAVWIDLIDFAETSPVRYIQKDLEVIRVATPGIKEKYGKETVAVKVRNAGSSNIDGFYLAYKTNENSLTVRQFFDISLTPGSDSVTVIFEKKADLSHYGTYDLVIFGYDNTDDYILNDTVRVTLENTVIDKSVRIFPNPFREAFSILITSKVPGEIKISVINATGQKIFESDREIVEGETTIVIDDLVVSPSVYYVIVKGPNIFTTIPVIKVN